MRFLVLLLVALMAGCAVAPQRPTVADPDAAWRARQASLARVTAWNVRGRLALRSADEGFQATLLWTRGAEKHRIELTGPLGGGRVRLTQDENGAELRDGNDKVYRDSSVQQLLWRRTGWNLPLDGLNFWVLGLPAPGDPTRQELDAWGRLKSLEQRGWDIRFLEYAQHGSMELPSRVFIRRHSSAQSEATLEVRLVIEQWSLPGDAAQSETIR